MNFFQRMGQTAIDIGASAVCKIKTIVQISKINAMINKEEQTLKNLYLNIGKTYTCLSDSDIDLESMLSAVKECEQKIAEGEEKKRVLRKLQCCNQCGALISNTAEFCSACGNKMPVAEEKEVCVHCGGSVSKGMRFCTECGKPMPGIVREEKPILKVCPLCGAKLKKKDMFCTECGAKIK